MKHIHKQTLHTLFGFLGFLAAYSGFIAFTSPYSLPISMLVVPSLLLGGIVFFLVRLLQRALIGRGSRLFAVAVSVYIVVLSLLASLQQLGWKDAVFSGVLIWVFIFYYKRTRK